MRGLSVSMTGDLRGQLLRLPLEIMRGIEDGREDEGRCQADQSEYFSFQAQFAAVAQKNKKKQNISALAVAAVDRAYAAATATAMHSTCHNGQVIATLLLWHHSHCRADIPPIKFPSLQWSCSHSFYS